jgi:hypothetical protein
MPLSEYDITYDVGKKTAAPGNRGGCYILQLTKNAINTGNTIW